jgi:hypothetical protein
MISKEQLEIIAREKCPKAAKILGIELSKVRYYRRRIVEGHIDIKTPKKEERKPLSSILIQFPNLLPGQIQQMKNIYEYSPQSALKYCQVIQSYNDKYISDEEQVNCF